jgi:HlyD family secretion protein
VNTETAIRKMARPRWVKFIVIGVIAILVVFALLYLFVFRKTAAASQQVQQTVPAARGDISVTVTGSGPMSSSNKSDITSKVSGLIEKVYFKEGDTVKAGDLLVELDDSDAISNMQKIENTIAQLQLTQGNTLKSLNANTVSAPFSGEVNDIQIKVGDSVAKNGAILTLTNPSQFKLITSFTNSYRKSIRIGQEVIVDTYDTTLDTAEAVKGTVAYISGPSYTANDGKESYNVEILIHNTGTLKEGLTASAEIKAGAESVKSTKSGTLSYVNSLALKAEAGGTVKAIHVRSGQSVNKGTLLVEFQNDDLLLPKDTNDLKMADLQAQLDAARKDVEDCKIHAPIAGVISTLSVIEGNNLSNGGAVAKISDNGHMEFSVSIDELDIAKVEVGQTVNITVDALPDTLNAPLPGKVTKIAVEGASSNGVTTYPVTISIDQGDKLRGGMNANAEIVTSKKTGILILPVQAVQTMNGRSFVMMKRTGAAPQRNEANGAAGNTGAGNQSNGTRNNGNWGNRQSSGNTAGSTAANRMRQLNADVQMKPVEVGINNGEYIEIVSGLTEGEEVILPTTASTTTSQQRGGLMQMGIPAGGGGGGGNTFRRAN